METANISHRAIGADEKAFIGDSAEKFAQKTHGITLKNMRHALQLMYRKTDGYTLLGCRVRVKGALENYITLRVAANVPADVVPNAPGDFLLFDTPGLCPDRLEPIEVPQGIALRPDYTVSVFVTFELDGQAAAGEYETVFTLESADGEPLCKDTYVLTVVNAAADETDLKLTNWMHYDGICARHGVQPFSAEFYAVFESYLRLYTGAGFNMLYVPLFTPPLDTAVGHERRTVQLVRVKRTQRENADGANYRFDFSALKKFIRFAAARGIKYFEFSHLFTQWGGGHCPKIIAEECGEEKKIFGWESDSLGEEYAAFLNAFLPRLVSFLKREHIEKISYFHLTDEPAKRHLPVYAKCREMVKKHLKILPVFDALSDFEFYEKGLVDIPVPELDKSAPFFAAGVKEMFVYYCTPFAKYPNRSMNMPLLRVRVLGVLLYLCGAQGFLHWGFNFYNTQNSLAEIDPCADTSAGHCFFSGDQFIVYPHGGGAAGSLRAEAIAAGFYDYRALKTLERRAGRDHVLRLLNEAGVKSFAEYPHSAEKFDALMETVIREIAEA